VKPNFCFDFRIFCNGTGNGLFEGTTGIARDSAGNFLVVNYGGGTEVDCIEEFDSSGNYLTQVDTYGSGKGQIIEAEGIAIAPNGCLYVADSVNDRIDVFAPDNTAVAPVLPVANFTSNVTSGYIPLDVQFNDSSLNATHLEWNFGDNTGNTSVANPEHVFMNTGLFNVVLTANNTNDTSSINMTITVAAKPVPPVAEFTEDVKSGVAPLTVNFIGSVAKNMAILQNQ
jgi:PKD repeat protein